MIVRLAFSILAVVEHSARSWWPLLQKLWRQTRWKHHLQPFTVKSVLAALGPMEIENYAAVWADPNVPGLCRKARLLLGMHFIRWLEAIRIAHLLVSRG